MNDPHPINLKDCIVYNGEFVQYESVPNSEKWEIGGVLCSSPPDELAHYFILRVIDSGQIDKACRYFCSPDMFDDLRQEVVLALWETEPTKVLTLHRDLELERFVFGIAKRMATGNNSALNYHHNRWKQHVTLTGDDWPTTV